jgi:hypothetical protein
MTAERVLKVLDDEIAALPTITGMMGLKGVSADPTEAVDRLRQARTAVAELVRERDTYRQYWLDLVGDDNGKTALERDELVRRNGELTAAVERKNWALGEVKRILISPAMTSVFFCAQNHSMPYQGEMTSPLIEDAITYTGSAGRQQEEQS